MSNQWVIGTLPDCDLSINQPGVSGRHCRLTVAGDGYTLEDLQSKSGTFVNGVRIAGKAKITASDAITLGPDVPMPWPPELGHPVQKVLRVGRESDNDFVINLPIVSGYHARITWEGRPGQAVIEDLGSSNGTAIGALDRKVTRSAFSSTDTIFFGTHAVPATELLAKVDPSHTPALLFQGMEMVIGRDPSCQRVLDLATISGRHARLKRSGDGITIEDLGSSNGTFVNGRRAVGVTTVREGDVIGLGRDSFRLALKSAANQTQRIESIGVAVPGRPSPTLKMSHGPAQDDGPEAGSAGFLGHPAVLPSILLAQAPILAILIGLAFGSDIGSPMTPVASKAIASALFAFGLASVWFGLSNGVAGLWLDPNFAEGHPSPRWWGARLAVFGAICLGQVVLAAMIVYPLAGLGGLNLSTLALLLLGSWVGLAAGFVIVLLSPRSIFSWAALGVALVSLWIFGGGPASPSRMAAPIRLFSHMAPSRWAFEGLLLSETPRGPKPGAVGGPDPVPKEDLAEAYFPAESDRMGPGADAMALGAMLIGLAAAGLALVTSSPSQDRPSTASIA